MNIKTMSISEIGLRGLILLFFVFHSCNTPENGEKVSLTKTDDSPLTYILPSPNTNGNVSVEKALENRRSQRNFQEREISWVTLKSCGLCINSGKSE